MTEHAIKPTIVLIPAFEPGNSLIKTTDALIAAGIKVVVVDDGSGPEYASVFAALQKKVHVLHHDTNLGKGAALKTGYAYIATRYKTHIIITADADGQHTVDDILEIRRAYQHHPGALLLGVRNFSTDNVPLRSKFGNTITRQIFMLVTKKRFRDTQTGLRAFDDSLTDFMRQVHGEKFEYETNVLLTCSKARIPLAEHSIATVYTDNNASSHFDPVKDSWSIYREILKFVSSSFACFCLDYVLFLLFLGAANFIGVRGGILLANVLARIVSGSANFLLNRRFVFNHPGDISQSALHYAGLAIAILLGNTLLLSGLVEIVGTAPHIAKICTELSFFCASLLYQKYSIFSPRKESNPS